MPAQDTKITALTAIGANPINVATFPIPMVDLLDNSMAASGTTKKVTVNQILGAGGTATLASATVTGDLTVRSNKLVVTSAGVGFGTTTPAYPAHFRTTSPVIAIQDDTSAATGVGGTMNFLGYTSGTSGANVFAQIKGVKTAGSAGGEYQVFTSDSVGNSVQRYLIDSTGVSTWSVGGSTAMTLNSTGLGVGVVGANGIKLSSFVTTDGAPATSGTTQSTGSLRIGAASTTGAMDMGTAGSYSWIQVLDRGNLATNYDLVLQKNGGNVGIGVTPSAWTSAFGSVLQFKSAGSSAGGSLTGSSADNFRMFSNTYYDGAYKYIAAGFATQYEQSAGSHVWYLSGTTAGAINGAITFSTALSLDKTGSLVLGSAAVATTATDGFLYIPSCAGAPTGVPTTKTGRVPMVVDSTNNRFYVYVGGTWKYTTLA